MFSGFQSSPEELERARLARIKRINIQTLIVTVTETSGKVSVLEYDGYINDINFLDSYWICDASYRREQYMKACGGDGCAYVGNSTYIPMCNVAKIEFDVVDKYVDYDTENGKILKSENKSVTV